MTPTFWDFAGSSPYLTSFSFVACVFFVMQGLVYIFARSSACKCEHEKPTEKE